MQQIYLLSEMKKLMLKHASDYKMKCIKSICNVTEFP